MSNWRWLSIILAMMFTAGSFTHATAQRPDPHRPPEATPMATAIAAGGSAGCDLVEAYTNDLYATIDNSGAFADFFYSDDNFGDVTPEEAESIIEDGAGMIATMERLDVPGPYADAHIALIAFLQFHIDTARFYGLDTSVVPSFKDYDVAIDVIYEGETALAEACPNEVAEVGGYILLDPSELPPDLNPETVPE